MATHMDLVLMNIWLIPIDYCVGSINQSNISTFVGWFRHVGVGYMSSPMQHATGEVLQEG